jgi:DNA-binding NarL/FixJ family response regulator
VLNSLEPNDLASDPTRLTARERQVLALIAQGKTGKEIAAELGITLRTARFHREKLAQKLGSSSAAWLTRYAIEHGIDGV